MVLGIQDAAGAITFCNSGNAYNVFSVDIQTFLKESKCFIATASFRSGKTSEVMLLRHFRDQFLSRFDWGRSLIQTYYHYSPRAADWLIDHSAFRPIILRALVPFEVIAWIFVSGTWLWALGVYVFILLFFLIPKSKASFLFFVIGSLVLCTTSLAQTIPQPYIDSLLSTLPQAPSSSTDDLGSSSYTQSIKNKLNSPQPEEEPYTEQIKKKLQAQPSTEGYSEDLKNKLPLKPEITTEQNLQRKLHADKQLSIRSDQAFGFNLGVNQVRDLSASELEEISFDELYPSFWIPDLKFYYENRPFHLGSSIDLGLYGSVEAMWLRGTGKFPSWVPTLYSSQTKLTFFIVPINLGTTLRFNIADFIYPYVGVGPNFTAFYESRSDSQPSNKSYSLGVWFSAGANFGIDWLSTKDSWSQYDNNKIKHNYLSLEFTNLSVAGGTVHASIQTFALGFLHEL
jgi:hypothetical protein